MSLRSLIRVTNPRNGLSKDIDIADYTHAEVSKTINVYGRAKFRTVLIVDGCIIPTPASTGTLFLLKNRQAFGRINRGINNYG